MHGQVQPGTTFVQLNGFSIDNRFTDCSADGINFGIVLTGAAQGIHITNCVLLAGVGLTTGTASFPNAGNGWINLLQLMISNSEFNCTASALSLFQVVQGMIQSSHFNATTSNVGAVNLISCSNIQFTNCQFTGGFSPDNGAGSFGALIGGGSGGNSQLNQFDNCSFGNVTVGIVLVQGAQNTTGTGMRMCGVGNGSLQAGTIVVGNVETTPVLDWSGATTNHFQCFGPTGLVNLS
jgi:hypothetical protein